MSDQPKVALVHDDFMQTGGAESLFASIASLYPNAPIYTSLVDWNKLPPSINHNRIKTSFIQKLAIAKKWYRAALPLYPLAFESFNFDEFDLVISSTTRFAKSIITKPKTTHICYINSIPRFLYNLDARRAYLPSVLYFLTLGIFNWLKRWDKTAASRVDYFIANSQNVKDQVAKNYGYKSEVVYPFADLNFFKVPKVSNWQLKSQKYFLVVSRLVKWKKIEIAIGAARELNVNLKIVGSGPDDGRLKQLTVNSSRFTDNSIEFLGKVTQEELRELYQNCEALIVTQEEDFGISALEAQACGCPVIAYKKGGVAEIVKDGQTGLLFEKQTKQSLKDAIDSHSRVKWESTACRKNSLRFSQAAFVNSLKETIKAYARYS